MRSAHTFALPALLLQLTSMGLALPAPRHSLLARVLSSHAVHARGESYNSDLSARWEDLDNHKRSGDDGLQPIARQADIGALVKGFVSKVEDSRSHQTDKEKGRAATDAAKSLVKNVPGIPASAKESTLTKLVGTNRDPTYLAAAAVLTAVWKTVGAVAAVENWVKTHGLVIPEWLSGKQPTSSKSDLSLKDPSKIVAKAKL